jgi:hypothetical protein
MFSSHLIYFPFCQYLDQGCTNSWRSGDKFFTVAPNVCGSSVWNLFFVDLRAPRILRLLLNFWKKFENPWFRYTNSSVGLSEDGDDNFYIFASQVICVTTPRPSTCNSKSRTVFKLRPRPIHSAWDPSLCYSFSRCLQHARPKKFSQKDYVLCIPCFFQLSWMPRVTTCTVSPVKNWNLVLILSV